MHSPRQLANAPTQRPRSGSSSGRCGKKRRCVRQQPNTRLQATDASSGTQKAQQLLETRHFQRVHEQPDDCCTPWALFYDHCGGSLDLPLREQIRLRYQRRGAELDACGGPQSTASSDTFDAKVSETGLLDGCHRLLVAYGTKVEWQLYFQTEEQLQRSLTELLGCLTLAMLEKNNSAAQAESSTISMMTPILVETLTNLINRFVRKWQMVLQSSCEENIATLRFEYSRAASKLRQFLRLSRLSFLGPMLRPNPNFAGDATQPPFRGAGANGGQQQQQQQQQSTDSQFGQSKVFGGRGAGARSVVNQSDFFGTMYGVDRNYDTIGASETSLRTSKFKDLVHGRSMTGSLASVEQNVWLPCKYTKMYEAPVTVHSATDCHDDDSCFGAFVAVRRRCQSLVSSPCTGCGGRFCLDKGCSTGLRRWLFVGDTYVGLLNTETNEVEEVMLFSADFHVFSGDDIKRLGATSIEIVTNHCQLQVACQREVDACTLMRAIEDAMSAKAVSCADGSAGTEVSNGYLFSRRLSDMQAAAASQRFSDRDSDYSSTMEEEQALMAALAASAPAASTGAAGNASNASREHRKGAFLAERTKHQKLLQQDNASPSPVRQEEKQQKQRQSQQQQQRQQRNQAREQKERQQQRGGKRRPESEVLVGSFAPPRSATKVQWYVDAGSYFYAVADAIDMAQTEIFISGTVLTPEIYLKRPDAENRYQLGRLLIEKAKLRVQVFILLDNPNCLRQTNSCLHVLNYFEGVPNLHVMLSPFDPDSASDLVGKNAFGLLKAFLVTRKRMYNACFGPLMGHTAEFDSNPAFKGSSSRIEDMYYTHNEKFVVIDQKVALISGVDFTWGSWDTSLHVINDVPMNSAAALEAGRKQFKGQEACVKAHWANPGARCGVLSPPIMSCLEEDVAEDDRTNVKQMKSDAAMIYLPDSLRDLVHPKEKLGTDTDYDNFALTKRAHMTKPYSPFTDAGDFSLNPQYFESVRLLDSRYRNAVRVPWTFQGKMVQLPELRNLEAAGCLPSTIAEPAYASEIFCSGEEFGRPDLLARPTVTAAEGDLEPEFRLLQPQPAGPEKAGSDGVRTGGKLKASDSGDAPSEILSSRAISQWRARTAAYRSRLCELGAATNTAAGACPPASLVSAQLPKHSNNSNAADPMSLDDLTKNHVCVAGCMVLRRELDDPNLAMSDDSDTEDIDCFPADLVQPLIRSLDRGREGAAAEQVRSSWLAPRVALQRLLASTRQKLLQLRLHSHHYWATPAAATSADVTQLSKRKQLLIESLESEAGSRQPQLRRHIAVKDDGTRFTTRLFPGLDYANSRLLMLTEKHHNNPNNPPSGLDPEREPRLPIHSVGLAVFGSAARDVARHFIERWNFASANVYSQARNPVQVTSYGKTLKSYLSKPLLVPRFYVAHDLQDCELLVRRTACLRSVLDYPFATNALSLSNQMVNFVALDLDENRAQQSGFEEDEQQKPGEATEGDLRERAKNEQIMLSVNTANMPTFLAEKSLQGMDGSDLVQDEEFINCLERLSQGRTPHSCRVTVLRSLGKWSGGLYRHLEERSVLQAYYSAIKSARRFLYLETELFISQTRNRSTDATVKNRICFYMYKRILAAKQAGEPFKIYLVIPVLQKNHGELLSETDGDYINRRTMHYMYQCIFKGQNSLVHRLLQRNIAPDEYLCVCSLVKYERLLDGWLAHDIYVQSNLLIVDDQMAIIGSPSVSDRGLLGYKNSELAVRIEDPSYGGGDGGGGGGGVGDGAGGGFVRSLRLTLWGEHLDMPARSREALIGDPGLPAVWNLWRSRATRNSQILHEVFRVVPNNAANTIDRLRYFTSIHYLRRRAKLFSNRRSVVAEGLEKLAEFRGTLVRYSGHFLEGSDLSQVDSESKQWRAALLWPDFSLV